MINSLSCFAAFLRMQLRMLMLETKMATRISTRRRKQVHRFIDELYSTTEYLVNE